MSNQTEIPIYVIEYNEYDCMKIEKIVEYKPKAMTTDLKYIHTEYCESKGKNKKYISVFKPIGNNDGIRYSQITENGTLNVAMIPIKELLTMVTVLIPESNEQIQKIIMAKNL